MKVNDAELPIRFARQNFLWMEMAQAVFSWAKDDFGELDERYQLFVSTCEAVINPDDFSYARWTGNGRPRNDRIAIAKAFLYKATFNIPTTKELVRQLHAEPLARQLCGWSSEKRIPSETGFSNANAEFAERGFTEKWFEDVVVENHVAVTQDGFPVAWTYTSASLHDSQAMIPLVKQAVSRVPHSFDLADAAYDAEAIRTACANEGSIAIIDRNLRKSSDTSPSMSETEAETYKQRTSAERYFSHLLESHGGRTVRVRTPKKIALHLMFGTLVVAVEQLMRMTC